MNRLTDPSVIRPLLARHGFRFSHSLGQNFLVDASVPARVADSLGTDGSSGVMEVGPGIGCLTAELATRSAAVFAVEADCRLQPLLAETLADYPNVRLFFGDALKQDLRRLAEENLPQTRRLFCANLPYGITSPILTDILEADCFERICVMVQKEVAERICAEPGGRDYGAFSLFVQWHCSCEMLFSVPPHCFMPQPKVTSAVILLSRREQPAAQVSDEALLFRVIRGAFNQRRKTLPNALAAAFPELGKAECEKILKLCDLDTNLRAEKLVIGDFAKISNEFAALL